MRALIFAGCCTLLSVASLPAQVTRWAVSLEVGEARFGGTSADTSLGGDGALRPFRPSTLGLRFERGGGPVRVGLGIVYGSAEAALEGTEATLVSRASELKLFEVAPALGWRVHGREGGAGLYLSGGPILDRWTWAEGEPRTRLGAAAALRLEAPIGTAATALVRVGVGVTGSVFNSDELPPAFARRASWRRDLSVGLLLRL